MHTSPQYYPVLFHYLPNYSTPGTYHTVACMSPV
uniref:Uncharacterized protein n=1 Tax=Anguilla anguilla TaxID=7936 RepID=A0A0E9TBM1_ANGAN